MRMRNMVTGPRLIVSPLALTGGSRTRQSWDVTGCEREELALVCDVRARDAVMRSCPLRPDLVDRPSAPDASDD